jgi:hypothetical protein
MSHNNGTRLSENLTEQPLAQCGDVTLKKSAARQQFDVIDNS